MAFMHNEITDLGNEEELGVRWTQFNRVGYPLGAFFGDRFIIKTARWWRSRTSPGS